MQMSPEELKMSYIDRENFPRLYSGCTALTLDIEAALSELEKEEFPIEFHNICEYFLEGLGSALVECTDIGSGIGNPDTYNKYRELTAIAAVTALQKLTRHIDSNALFCVNFSKTPELKQRQAIFTEKIQKIATTEYFLKDREDIPTTMRSSLGSFSPSAYDF
jgi:hypothetical protein